MPQCQAACNPGGPAPGAPRKIAPPPDLTRASIQGGQPHSPGRHDVVHAVELIPVGDREDRVDRAVAERAGFEAPPCLPYFLTRPQIERPERPGLGAFAMPGRDVHALVVSHDVAEPHRAAESHHERLARPEQSLLPRNVQGQVDAIRARARVASVMPEQRPRVGARIRADTSDSDGDD